MNTDYLIGQRVILNNSEIGTITIPENNNLTNCIWVYSPKNKHTSCYAKHNIKPLPNGQL